MIDVDHGDHLRRQHIDIYNTDFIGHLLDWFFSYFSECSISFMCSILNTILNNCIISKMKFSNMRASCLHNCKLYKNMFMNIEKVFVLAKIL